MKIYIPPHLKDFEIFSQLIELVREYSTNYYEDFNDSFSGYSLDLLSDPVEKFLRLCIDSSSISSDNNYEDVINYLVKLFYSVKGTVKVLEYMKQYLNLGISGDILYSTEALSLQIGDLSTTSENSFISALEGFLNSLLYFKELNLGISVIELNLKGEVTTQISGDGVYFYEFTAEILKL